MTQRSRRRHRHRGGLKSKLLFVAAGAIALVAALAIGVASWGLDVAANAPPLSACKPIERGGNSVLFDGEENRLGYIASDEARTPVAIDRVPADLKYATVAIEDERFFEHDGVDIEGGLRALRENIEAGEIVEGGSTITMQLMRNLCISDPERNVERKIQEMKLAWQYEDRFSKQDILGKYLNGASYGTINGTTAVGVQAASRIYFSKPVWKLTLEQAALLAGLPQAPSDYNPVLNPEGALQRRNSVLSSMAKLGYITRDRALTGQQRGLGLKLSDTYFTREQPYFFDYVSDKLIEKYGVNTVRQGGLRVYTTIDPDLQRIGLEAMRSALPYSEDPAAALVSIEPETGFIKAMVSSSEYEDSQFNLAAQGHRQPGSTFKTFVLTTAIKQGIDPYSTYYTSKPLNLDLPEWGHWEVATADEGYQGTINLQQATVASDNTVFAQLDLDVGPENVAETAKSLGIETELDGIPAEGIGGLRIGVSPLEMSAAYATLAAGGIRRNPVAIRRVVFPDGRVDHPEHADPRRVVNEAVAYEVTQLLRDNITGGTGTAAYTGCGGQAGKTGTTDNYTDAWFAGYQPNLSTVVWVGYPQSNDIEMTSVHGTTVFGGTFPAQIWNSLYVNGEIPCEEYEEPETPISWAPYYGQYTQSGGYSDADEYDYSEEGEEGEDGEDARRARRAKSPARRRSAATTPTHTRLAPARSRLPRRPRTRHPLHPRLQAEVVAAAERRPAASGPDSRRRLRALGLAGLGGLAVATFGLAAPGPGLVPAAVDGGPGWLLGPYGEGLGLGAGAYYGLLWIAFASHLCVFFAAPALDRRLIRSVAFALVAAFALAPPLLSADVFSYIAYARLDDAGLNPYERAPLAIGADPVFPHVGWTESPSAYGPLFTIATLPLAWLSVPAALWTLKAVAAASVLGLALLVARLAPARGIDPRRGFVMVALNPLVLVHVVGGAHNDALTMLVALAGCAGVLALRETSGGGAALAAVGLKLSAAFVAPFALLGSARRARWVAGAAVASAAVAGAAMLAFGPPALDSAQLAGENQGRVSNYSLPNLLSELSGLDVDALRALTAVAYAALVAGLLLRVGRGGDWIKAAGWAAVGLLLASAWLLPWYVIWALPFAALSRDGRLVAAVLALTALQLAARVPL